MGDEEPPFTSSVGLVAPPQSSSIGPSQASEERLGGAGGGMSINAVYVMSFGGAAVDIVRKELP